MPKGFFIFVKYYEKYTQFIFKKERNESGCSC